MENKNIYQKIFNIQNKIGKISKNAQNPFFKSKYFDINGLAEQLQPLLEEEGLVLMQPLAEKDGKPALITTIVDVESGEMIETITLLLENTDPQKMGSIITYFRRYAIQSLLFLQAEDNDANIGSKPVNTQNAPIPQIPPNTSQQAPQQENKVCQKCGAKIVLNPNTGKLFCEDKCWLKEDKPVDAVEVLTNEFGTAPPEEEPTVELKDLPF